MEDQFDKNKQIRFHLKQENAEQIMQAFEETFSSLRDEIDMACDAGG